MTVLKVENPIEIYQTNEGETAIEVRLQEETVWLTQKQMAEVFNTTPQNITIHLKNVFEEGELEEQATCKHYLQVQQEGGRMVERKQRFYNLDAILSVGYRINSKQGTLFRKWATNRLKEYLVKGYSLNQNRLKQLSNNLSELEQTIKTIQLSGNSEQLQIDEAKGLLDIIGNYTRSFVLLNQYDSNRLPDIYTSKKITYEIEEEEALKAIADLKQKLIEKKEATELFGRQKDQSFSGISKSVIQTFEGEYLYPSIEEQAGNLLYFVIKNHPFNDGNKRIGAFLFVWFLEKNKHQFNKNGDLKINNNALTALALLVAHSDPSDKDLMVKLIVNLIAST